MNNNAALFDCLFETSWEVCNKIGGIYTVLSTKAKTLQTINKDKTIFIGPDVWSAENPSPYFIEQPSVLKGWHSHLQLPFGLTVRTGRWDVPGRPIVVLVKFDTMYAHKDEFYGKMWEMFGVDSLHGYGDYDEACCFSLAAAMVIESLNDYLRSRSAAPDDMRIVAHFDEWTTGMGLLYIRWKRPRIATVFTTHATSIGRSICGNGKPLYDFMAGYHGDQMAEELNMQSKHSLEKTAAQTADCFTTVSDVTAVECEQLLERRPDIVTPNGFEKGFVPAKSKQVAARKEAREKLLGVATALTGKEYPDDTFIIATSGRCEYRNKGIDVYLDAMRALADCDNGSKRPVVAFVLVPAWSKEPRADLQKAIAARDGTGLDDPVITHVLNNPWEDPILGRIHALDFNAPADRLSVIYVPCYLNGTDGIFDTPYYGLLPGLDATVFPSYYEPWGYTPLESVAFGVPTVTTSLSGFGQWILNCFGQDPSFADCGVNVIRRTDGNYEQVVSAIARSIGSLIEAPEKAEETARAARETAAMAAWSYFIDYYMVAYTMAEEAAAERN